MFSSFTLNAHRRGDAIKRILQAAFDSAHAGKAVKEFVKKNPLPESKRTFLFGLGKAACAMTDALAELIPFTDALVITKHASALKLKPVTVIEGNHPVPGMNSLKAGQAALRFVSQLTSDDLLVCLISGGGSALMTAPIIPLEELQALTEKLLASGARIDEINTIRRHLDLVKGGGLAGAANGAQIISLVLSDVIGDSLEAIASGPTAPDPSSKEDAKRVLQKINADYELKETLKPDDPLFVNVQNHIIASNQIALQAAKQQAETEGFYTKILHTDVQGEAYQVGKNLADWLRADHPRPFCLLAGGETTVTLKGNGKGGRNMEAVLGAVKRLSEMKDVMFISIATDGEDGSTDAAGAVADEKTLGRGEMLGMAESDFRLRNDAYVYFDSLNDLLKPGPSGTNVNDLILLFGF